MNIEQQLTDIIERLKRIEIYIAELVGRTGKQNIRVERRGNTQRDDA